MLLLLCCNLRFVCMFLGSIFGISFVLSLHFIKQKNKSNFFLTNCLKPHAVSYILSPSPPSFHTVYNDLTLLQTQTKKNRYIVYTVNQTVKFNCIAKILSVIVYHYSLSDFLKKKDISPHWKHKEKDSTRIVVLLL